MAVSISPKIVSSSSRHEYLFFDSLSLLLRVSTWIYEILKRYVDHRIAILTRNMVTNHEHRINVLFRIKNI
jgi:uncharacterized protein YaaR (DUF327 family)